MTTPFSTDRVSLGRPAICQLLTLTGSARVEVIVGSSVCGTAFCPNLVSQLPIISLRNSPLQRNIERIKQKNSTVRANEKLHKITQDTKNTLNMDSRKFTQKHWKV